MVKINLEPFIKMPGSGTKRLVNYPANFQINDVLTPVRPEYKSTNTYSV